jgi:hypothetical protein
MSIVIKSAAAAALAIGLCAAPASAIVWTFSDPVDGIQETPPNASPGFAIASGSYDDVTNTLSLQINQSTACIALVSNAHIHTAPPGVPGGVSVPLPGPFNVSPFYNLAPTNFVLTAAQETDFLAGLMYVNIHSQQFPGGEIRGQLRPVPAPGALAILGLAGLVIRRRR